MKTVITFIVAAAFSYLLGCLNGAILMSRVFFHEDIRKKGSGNAALTNYYLNYGAGSSVLVIAIDVLKAVLACLIGGWVLGTYGYHDDGVALGALGVILGHDFPVLLDFKGGKGILSGVTEALMLDWRLGLAVFAIFVVAYAFTSYVSLGSVLSAGSFGFLYDIFHWGSCFPIIVSFVLSFLIVWMHRANIERLLKGEERKTNLFKGKDK